MDFPSFWKTSSIISTAAFGILGLLKEFKNKQTGTLTAWGYLSIGGMIVSAILGVSAQLIESANADKKGAEQAYQTERLLAPVKKVQAIVSLTVPCLDPAFRRLCDAAPTKPWMLTDAERDHLYKHLWSTVPLKKNNTGVTSVDVYGTVRLKTIIGKAGKPSEGESNSGDSDLNFLLLANSDGKENRLNVEKRILSNGQSIVVLVAYAEESSSSGVIQSALDFAGCMAVIQYSTSIQKYNKEIYFKPALLEFVLGRVHTMS